MTDTADKVRENRLRRAAHRQGLSLQRSRRRDPRAIGHGTYQLVDTATKTIVAGDHNHGYGLDLDEVHHELVRNIGAAWNRAAALGIFIQNRHEDAVTFDDTGGDPILRHIGGREGGWTLYTVDMDGDPFHTRTHNLNKALGLASVYLDTK